MRMLLSHNEMFGHQGPAVGTQSIQPQGMGEDRGLLRGLKTGETELMRHTERLGKDLAYRLADNLIIQPTVGGT
ncbi:MAG: hypothetical protein ACKOBY_10335 [Cyanobium sp.]